LLRPSLPLLKVMRAHFSKSCILFLSIYILRFRILAFKYDWVRVVSWGSSLARSNRSIFAHSFGCHSHNRTSRLVSFNDQGNLARVLLSFDRLSSLAISAISASSSSWRYLQYPGGLARFRASSSSRFLRAAVVSRLPLLSLLRCNRPPLASSSRSRSLKIHFGR
jgi:hypothetical protein